MIIDALEKTIQIKIVYFGPALSGKTTSLKCLFNHFGMKEDVMSIESTINRTLFFDYGIIKFKGTAWLLKIHIYSTTGQDFYRVTRPITLRAVDGIIFVVDSQKSAYKRNLASWDELISYYGERLEEIPIIIAFNKQDVLNKFETSTFLHDIKLDNFPNLMVTNTIALNGEGILTSFEEILGKIFKAAFNLEFVTQAV